MEKSCTKEFDVIDKWTWSVIFAAVASGVAHIPDLGFIEVGQFVFLSLGTEVQLVNLVDDLAQVVAALNLVLDLSKYLPNLVFNGVGAARLLLEAVQVGKKFPVNKIAEVVTGQGLVVVKFAVLALGRGPALPPVGRIKDMGIFLPIERSLGALVLLKIIQVFKK